VGPRPPNSSPPPVHCLTIYFCQKALKGHLSQRVPWGGTAPFGTRGLLSKFIEVTFPPKESPPPPPLPAPCQSTTGAGTVFLGGVKNKKNSSLYFFCFRRRGFPERIGPWGVGFFLPVAAYPSKIFLGPASRN